ncbi:hypothetical protein [Streptomyces iconiensis]|uniref:Uncharacterized protein n=1 Tax=Streptomyces iconiensis TaxID=1384038 RepID=A0ABT6ZR11_9ACTN|nr:hypothetical protein [Streptomyces iconiensis]MDJ1131494.1 hypothetical protein [Streptomyces iconiensis]
MDARGAVAVVLRGPAEKLPSTLATLREARLCAEPSPHAPDAIQVLFYSGEAGRPSPAFMDACTALTAESVLGTSFAVEETGTLEVSTAHQLAYRRDTGAWLGAHIDTSTPPEQRAQALEALAREARINPDNIELRDPPVTSLPME